jgi:hypothetical protein
MAIRRTKFEKQQTQLKRDAALTYSYKSAGSLPSTSKGVVGSSLTQSTSDSSEIAIRILGYAPTFIYQDLMKTVVCTAICLVVLAVIKMQVFP